MKITDLERNIFPIANESKIILNEEVKKTGIKIEFKLKNQNCILVSFLFRKQKFPFLPSRSSSFSHSLECVACQNNRKFNA